MRAADLGYASRFQAFFVARSWFRQSGVISSHPKRLTRAVKQTEEERDERPRDHPFRRRLSSYEARQDQTRLPDAALS